MKNVNLKTHIYVLSIIILLLLNLFVLGIHSRIISCLGLLFIFVISLLIFKYRKDYFYQKKSVMLTMSIIAIFQILIFYISGLFDGFSNNVIILSFNNILILVLPTIVSIILIELIRYLMSNRYASDKKLEVLSIIMFVLIDINLFGSSYNFLSLSDTLEFMGIVLFPSISSNIVYSRMTLSYGYKPIVIYRVMIMLSYYLIPIIPNTYVFFRAIFRIIYPVMFYFLITYMYERLVFENLVSKNRKGSILTVLILTIITILACLVSCKFKWGLLAIGSNSMKGTFETGDAVLFERYSNQDIEIGDVIIYEHDHKSVVHRVVEIGVFNGKYVYVTKGDQNKVVDTGYIYQGDIDGIVKDTIKYIGYPSIWVRRIFKMN